MTKFQGHKLGLLLAIIFVLTFFGKLHLLNERSTYIDPDEGYYLVLARNLYEGKGYTFNGLTNVSYPPFLPIAIGAVATLLGDYTFALNLISALAGCLLSYVCYLLVLRRSPKLIAFFAAVLVLTAYQLNAFFPRLVPYTSILYRGSELLGLLLVYLGFYFTLRFSHEQSPLDAFAAGSAFSLAYLTRPEALVIFACATLFLAFCHFIKKRRLSKSALVAFFLGFALFALPYLCFLRSVLGCWRLTGKTEGKNFGQAMARVIEKDDWKAFSTIHYSFDEERLEMSSAFWGFNSSVPPLVTLASQENLRANLRSLWRLPRTLFTPALFLLLPFGLALMWRRVKETDNVDDLLFLSLPLTSCVIILATYPIPRHHLFWVPAALCYSVEGLQYFSPTKKGVTLNRRTFLVGILLILSIGSDYYHAWQANILNDRPIRSFHEMTAKIGAFLQKIKAKKVMSRLPDVAVRAKTDWQVRPDVPMALLLKFARKKKVKFIELPIPLEPGRSLIDVSKSASLQDNDPWVMSRLDKEQSFAIVVIRRKP